MARDAAKNCAPHQLHSASGEVSPKVYFGRRLHFANKICNTLCTVALPQCNERIGDSCILLGG